MINWGKWYKGIRWGRWEQGLTWEVHLEIFLEESDDEPKFEE